MTTPVKIPIEADISGLKAALDALNKASAQLKQSLGDGVELKLDTTKAEAGLSSIEKSARSVQAAIAKVGGKVDLDAAGVTSALTEAEEVAAAAHEKIEAIGAAKVSVDTKPAMSALSELQKKVEAVHKPMTASAATLEQRYKRTAEYLSQKLGRQVTDHEARSFHSAFMRRARRDDYLKGYDDVAAWDKGVGARFSATGDAEAHRQSVLARLSASAGIAVPGAPGGKGKAMLAHLGINGRRAAGAMGGALGGMLAGAGDGGMFGSLGNMAGTGIGMGVGAFAGGPLGMLVGATLGTALGGLGRQLDQAMHDALQKGLDVSNLRRALGEQAASYDDLTVAIDGAARGMGITATESARMAAAFVKTGNIQGKEAAQLRSELRDMYGFARGLGIHPEQSTQFFGQMRYTGAAQDEKGARKLGIAVVDALARGGMFARSDEVMQILSGWATHSQSLDLEVNQDARFKSSVRLQSGGQELVYVDKEDDATLKRMKVFDRFALGIAPFYNGQPYQLVARLRYRAKEGAVSFWYELIRPDLVLQDAAKAEIAMIMDLTKVPVVLGDADGGK